MRPVAPATTQRQAGVAQRHALTACAFMEADNSEESSHVGGWGVEELDGYGQVTFSIEQGPSGLRFLTHWALVTSFANALMVCFGYHGSASGLRRVVLLCMVPYLVAACQLFFAVTALVFEVELSCLRAFSYLDDYQDFLLDSAPFLADVGARGLFFLLQGFMWLLFSSTQEPQHLVIGSWLVIVAVFDCCVHNGWMARRVIAKTRQVSAGGQRDLQMDFQETPSESPRVLGPGGRLPDTEGVDREGTNLSKGSKASKASMLSKMSKASNVSRARSNMSSVVAPATPVTSALPPLGGLQADACPWGAQAEACHFQALEKAKVNGPLSAVPEQKVHPAFDQREHKSCCEMM